MPLGELFSVFLLIGLTTFGGGASAHIHDAVVRRKGWLDEERFLEAMTLARSLPGTNVTNVAAFVGSMLAGYRGAALAVAGVVGPGILAVLAMAFAYVKLAAPPTHHLFRSTLHGLTAAAVGAMASLVAQSAKPVMKARAGLSFVAAAFVGVAILELDMFVVLAVLTPLASLAARTGASK